MGWFASNGKLKPVKFGEAFSHGNTEPSMQNILHEGVETRW